LWWGLGWWWWGGVGGSMVLVVVMIMVITIMTKIKIMIVMMQSSQSTVNSDPFGKQFYTQRSYSSRINKDYKIKFWDFPYF
jgi:hypothetical protein